MLYDPQFQDFLPNDPLDTFRMDPLNAANIRAATEWLFKAWVDNEIHGGVTLPDASGLAFLQDLRDNPPTMFIDHATWIANGFPFTLIP